MDPEPEGLSPRPFWTLTLGELHPKEWEALCDGCAKCCYLGNLFGRSLTAPCSLLNTETKCCSDYGNRVKREPKCRYLTLDFVAEAADALKHGDDGLLPASCAYVRRYEGMPLEAWQVAKAKENISGG